MIHSIAGKSVILNHATIEYTFMFDFKEYDKNNEICFKVLLFNESFFNLKKDKVITFLSKQWVNSFKNEKHIPNFINIQIPQLFKRTTI